jgi:hypothetical protein
MSEKNRKKRRSNRLILGDCWCLTLSNNSYQYITNTAWVRAGFVDYKEGALDSQPQDIKLSSCLSMVGVSLRVLRHLTQLRLVAMI